MIVDKKQRWRLANGEERNQKSRRFEIPPRSIRVSRQAHDLVKLLFETERDANNCQGERMWVEVVSVTQRPEGPLYIGTLANDPFVLDDCLTHGEQIVFGPEHVIGVEGGA